MLIEVNAAAEEIIVDGIGITFEILKALSHPDGSFYRMEQSDEGVLITRFPSAAVMIDPDYEAT